MKEKENEEKEKPKYNLPRAAEIWPCEWPCDAFLQAAGIYEDFYHLAGNAGITDFHLDRFNQYLLLTNTFVQNFHFHARKSPPTVDFHLYHEYKEMIKRWLRGSSSRGSKENENEEKKKPKYNLPRTVGGPAV